MSRFETFCLISQYVIHNVMLNRWSWKATNVEFHLIDSKFRQLGLTEPWGFGVSVPIPVEAPLDLTELGFSVVPALVIVADLLELLSVNQSDAPKSPRAPEHACPQLPTAAVYPTPQSRPPLIISAGP